MNNLHKQSENEFLEYLLSLKISKKSLNNYKSDANEFFSFNSQQNVFIPQLYIDRLLKSGKPAKSINRKLTTLRHISKFLLIKGYLPYDFMSGVNNINSMSDDGDVASKFEKELRGRKISNNTISNYLSDLKVFKDWCYARNIKLASADRRLIKEYLSFLSKTTSDTTLKRKTSSLNQFIEFIHPDNIKEPVPDQIQKSILSFSKARYAAFSLFSLSLFSLFIPFSLPTSNIPSINDSQETPLYGSKLNKNELSVPTKINNSKLKITISGEAFPEGVGDSSSIELLDGAYLIKDGEELSLLRIDETSSSEAGKGQILANESQTTIYNNEIDANSLVFVTLTSNSNQVIFVKEQGDGYFTVGFSDTSELDVNFNWWIVN